MTEECENNEILSYRILNLQNAKLTINAKIPKVQTVKVYTIVENK